MRTMRELPSSTSVSLTLAAVFLSACAPLQPVRATASGPQRQIVLVQVCLPDRRAEATEVDVDVSAIPSAMSQQEWEDLRLRVQITATLPPSPASERALVTLRNVLPDATPPSAPKTVGSGAASISNGVASDNSGGWPLSDVTGTGQPVYGVVIFREPREVLGVHVLQSEAKEPLQYWYALPPQAIMTDRFTDWIPPRYQEPLFGGLPVRDQLFSGKALPTGTVDARAPRVRLMTIQEAAYWASSGLRARALRMQDLMELTKPEARAPAARGVTGTIPSC